MASRFSLEAILSLTDNLTGPYKQTTNRITALNRGLTGSFGRLNRGINKTIGFIGTGLKRGAMIGLTALTVATGAAAREFVRLDDTITAAGAKFSDLDSTSSTFKDSLKELSSAARDVGSNTEFMATDAGGALDKFAMAGFNSAQSMALLRGTTDLATVANTDLTTAVDIATDSLGAFNLATEDTVQLEKNLARVSDVMAKTTVTANTSLEDLFESVKAGAPAFTAAGQSLETFNTFAGVMANAGIKGSTSGTALRNVMLRLSKPTGEASDILKQLGVQTQDSAGNFRDIIDILSDFEKGLVGMGSAQRTAALSTIFGARSVTGINVLLAEGTEELNKYRDNLIDSAGASKTMAESIRTSLGNRLKILRSGLTELGLKFIEAFEVQGRSAIDAAIDAVQNFDMQIIIDGIFKTVELFRQMIGFIRDNKGAIEALIIGMVSFKVAVIAVNAAMVIQMGLMAVGPVLGMIKALTSLAATEGILKTAQFALNMAMSANPIGLAITAVAALVAGIILLVKKWREFREEFQDASFGDFINPFSSQNRQTANERGAGRDSRGNPLKEGSRAARAVAQEKAKSITDGSIEARNRYDIFMHGPAGSGISTTPGGAPQPAVQLGAQ